MGLPINITELITGQVVEWERIELKQGWNPEATLRTLCAFANDLNNWGGGYVVIGVADDNGKPVLPPRGLSASEVDRIQKQLLQYCHLLRPHYFPIAQPATVSGKLILVLWAPGGPSRPYQAPDSLGKHPRYDYYVRRFSSTKRASPEEERELLGMANNVPFDDRINHAGSITDLNLTIVQGFLKEIGSDLSGESTAMPFADLCRRMRIAEGPEECLKPLNVGLLFFAENPQRFIKGAQIDVVVFSDESGDRFEERTFTGPLHDQLRGALNYVRSSVLVEHVRKVDGKAEAERHYNFPYAAVEEAVVNAVYHRSYEDDSPIEVRVFPERFEVLSYPGPMPPLDSRALKLPRVTARKYRNRRIGDFLKELELTEGRGTGFRKIRTAMEGNGSPPPVFETDRKRTYFLTMLPVHPEARVDKARVDKARVGKARVDKARVDKARVDKARVDKARVGGEKRRPRNSIVNRVIDMLGSGAMSQSVLSSRLGHRPGSGAVRRAIRALLAQRRIAYVFPDVPHSRHQKYRLTHRTRAGVRR